MSESWGPAKPKSLSTLERSKRKAAQALRQRGYYCCQRLNEAACLVPIWEFFSLNLAFHIFNFTLVRIAHQGPISIVNSNTLA